MLAKHIATTPRVVRLYPPSPERRSLFNATHPFRRLLLWHERERPHGASGSAGELQRRDDEQRTGPRQRAQVRELRNAVLPRAHEIVVRRERRVELGRPARVDADGLHPDADQRTLLGDPTGALDVKAGRVGAARTVGDEEGCGILGSYVPPRVQQQPTAFGQRSVLVLERAQIVDGEKIVGVLGTLGGSVDHDRRRDEVAGRHPRDVYTLAAAD